MDTRVNILLPKAGENRAEKGNENVVQGGWRSREEEVKSLKNQNVLKKEYIALMHLCHIQLAILTSVSSLRKLMTMYHVALLRKCTIVRKAPPHTQWSSCNKSPLVLLDIEAMGQWAKLIFSSSEEIQRKQQAGESLPSTLHGAALLGREELA